MLRILMTRRWAILTLVFFAIIPAMVLLGQWQYHRYEQTNRQNGSTAAAMAAPPVAMDVLSQPGATVPASETYRPVTATGHYDPAHEFVVRQRTDAAGDAVGYYVITPLVTDAGEVVLVNRGWVASPGDATTYPTVPPAPAGEVTVSGRLRPDETFRRELDGLPDRMFMRINSSDQAARLKQPVVAGYLELVSTSPNPPAADQAELVPSPNVTNTGDDAVVGKGVHLPYAIQWWLFAALIPAGWVVLLRRDLRDAREARAAEAAATGAGPDDEPSAGPDVEDGSDAEDANDAEGEPDAAASVGGEAQHAPR
ncbi:cytochrome oxidase assembly protein ShyY1 [Kitasatospora sp. GAS204A]|uniref:SURF1 family cytochrome oxidase biogenesis protein n=1 Tax=unclassified Kitasatospora TaxID=2633591 RepID=UPI002474A48A|nr:SURF1 family protein [Kitasatospora sp. GAS204B]MDH6121001.1 cytochrome oxidase assembly protein ShyY1 [Kitasatospora sp. GAS204B]